MRLKLPQLFRSEWESKAVTPTRQFFFSGPLEFSFSRERVLGEKKKEQNFNQSRLALGPGEALFLL